MLTALPVHIVLKYYPHIITVAQHGHNFYSSFSSNPQGAPYAGVQDTPLLISSSLSALLPSTLERPPSLIHTHLMLVSPLSSPYFALLICLSPLSFQLQLKLRLHFRHLTAPANNKFSSEMEEQKIITKPNYKARQIA